MTARITYNSKNIDLIIARGGNEPDFIQERHENRAASGKIETINIYGIQEINFEAYFSQATYYDLIAWWSWARQGKNFTFALDSTKTGNTTLDGSAAAGQKVIPLTSTDGFTGISGDICLIKAVDSDDEFEIVDIDYINVGVSVTVKENLKFSYTANDIFRHMHYWPAVKTKNKTFKPMRTGAIDNTGRYYRHSFNFIESL